MLTTQDQLRMRDSSCYHVWLIVMMAVVAMGHAM